MDANAIVYIFGGLTTLTSVVLSVLFNSRKKWELETYKSGNEELRAQAADHRQQIEDLKQQKHSLEFQIESKDILIAELKTMAQQIPALAELSKQQRDEHKEVIGVLADVAKGQSQVATTLADLVTEVKGRKNAISNRRRDRALKAE